LRTHYEDLQISENASPEVIKGAYRYLSQRWHPDKNPDNKAEAERVSSILNVAYSVLSDPAKRKEYDEWIRAQRQLESASDLQAGNPRSPEVALEAPVVPLARSSSFLRRAWLVLLFVASLVMLLGVLPYQLFTAPWQWDSVWVAGYSLVIGLYAYTSLFNARVVAGRKRKEKEGVLAECARGFRDGLASSNERRDPRNEPPKSLRDWFNVLIGLVFVTTVGAVLVALVAAFQ
jgi:curved DNA-binding protein CbpA